MSKPKILLFDIETAPILASVWRIFKENVGIDQIKNDWFVIAWAAKWLKDPPNKILYRDLRKNIALESDKEILRTLWNLIDEADIIVTHNGKRFDQKKVNARFLQHGFKPYSPVKHFDTCEMAYKFFGFTSNKLQFLTDRLNKKYKKLKHKDFPGFDLWKECLAGNPAAWKSMEKYNKHDVLALEELYLQMAPWDHQNLFIYEDELKCKCGSENIQKRGFAPTNQRKYQRYQCQDCGFWFRGTAMLRGTGFTGAVR